MDYSVMKKHAFSLVEMIIVVVIIGILAAIAIPRLSRGASGASDSGVKGNLSVMRNAIELYFYEHGEYPGKNSDGTNAAGSEGAVIGQLIKYSDDNGVVGANKSSTYKYGPYLRKGIPPCPISPRLGKSGIEVVSGTTVPAYAASNATAGWVMNIDTGDIIVNSNGSDEDGIAYSSY